MSRLVKTIIDSFKKCEVILDRALKSEEIHFRFGQKEVSS